MNSVSFTAIKVWPDRVKIGYKGKFGGDWHIDGSLSSFNEGEYKVKIKKCSNGDFIVKENPMGTACVVDFSANTNTYHGVPQAESCQLDRVLHKHFLGERVSITVKEISPFGKVSE